MKTILIFYLLSLFCFSEIFGVPKKTTWVEDANEVIDLTPNQLNQLESGEWLFEIYAPWCGYCRQVAPTLEEVAKKFQNLKVARIDGDKYLGKKMKTLHFELEIKTHFTEIQLQFLIGGFPSIYHIKDGEVRLYSEGYKYEQFETYLKGGWKSKEPLPYYKSPISLA